MMNLHQRATALFLFFGGCAAQPSFNCNPCIYRSDHVIKAVVQGTKSDPFWQQIEAAMRQSEKDMRMTLDMELYDTLDTQQMAADIRAAIDSRNPPQALIVSIPSESVKAAVSEAIDFGLPVFGMYSGYQYFEELNMQGFVAMDQEEAGAAAGAKFLEINEEMVKVAYISHIEADEDFDTRRIEGLKSGIADVTDVEKSTVVTSFESCPFDAVLLANADLLEYVLKAYEDNGCDFTLKPIATFGTSKDVHSALSSGKLAFAISESQYLQGSLSVLSAALFATTGKNLAPSSESTFGMQTVGPVITTKEHLLSDTMQACIDDAFPVCPDTYALDRTSKSACDCTDRKKIKIAGVLHAVTTDAFWDVVYESTKHAADDFGVELILDRMEPNSNPDVLYEKMAGQIESLCKQGVDGIFVTIPNEIVLEEIQLCMDLNVPVVSINAGPEYSKSMGLYHHIGMVERNAGAAAGKRMASTGQMKQALCLMHAPDNNVLESRCGGFEEGVATIDPNIEFLGAIDVPEDNDQQYQQIVESYIKENTDSDDDWEGIGILLAGQPQIGPGLMLKEAHKDVMLGVFDTDEQLFQALDEGKILWAIDQGPYLQGYLPIALLTWQAYTKQQLSNHLVETGPAFITKAPSAEESSCQASHFPVCARPESIAAVESLSQATDQKQGSVIAVSVMVAVLALAVGFLSYRIHQLNKFARKVRSEGQEVPKLTAGKYCAGLYQSPDKIVGVDVSIS